MKPLITLNGTLAGNAGTEDLTLTASGTSAINGAISNITLLDSDAAGTTKIGANVTTAGAQTYADDVEIVRWIALPLLGDELVVALDQRLFRPMAATGGEIAHLRLVHDADIVGPGFDLRLGGLHILAHTISASPRSTLAVSTTVRMIEGYAAHRQI